VPLPEEDDAQDGAAMIATTPDPESAAIHGDAKRALDRLIATLPAEYREVLILREIEDLGYREIAAVINVPIGTVMSRLARARAALRSRWLQESEATPYAVR
jgi:RNA polymerase sigma factor (sigma-70 family)